MTGVVQPKILKGFLSLAEEEEGSLVESQRVVTGFFFRYFSFGGKLLRLRDLSEILGANLS